MFRVKKQSIYKVNKMEDVNFRILSNPKFFTEGTAISYLLNQDRILIEEVSRAIGSDLKASIGWIWNSFIQKNLEEAGSKRMF